MSYFQEVKNNPLNYVAMYEPRKNRIVSVPRTVSVWKHVGLSFLYLILSFVISGFLGKGVQMLLKHIAHLSNSPWWVTLIADTVSGIWLVFAFIVLAPRFGMFPGINGRKLQLTESTMDKKLAELIKKNPRRFNVDWFGDWSDATLREQDRLYQDMKSALSSKKTKG